MSIKPYWQYLKYVLEHKRNVFMICWQSKMYKHAFTHDLSKFFPSEFFPYARYFYINKEKYQTQFDDAWKLHYTRNKHHWNYWIGKEMPNEFIFQMIADWKAMSLKFGDTAQAFYLKNYKKIQLEYDTRMRLEYLLGINDSLYHNYGHTLEDLYRLQGLNWWNRSYGLLKEKYGVDLLEVFDNKN